VIMSFFRFLHIAAFVILLASWTWALLSPNPVPEPIRESLGIDWQFLLSKLLHASGYTTLTVLGGTLTKPGRPRRAMVAFLALHAIGSEVAQATMDLGRHGCIRDVLIDGVGIAAGVVMLRWRDSRKST